MKIALLAAGSAPYSRAALEQKRPGATLAALEALSLDIAAAALREAHAALRSRVFAPRGSSLGACDISGMPAIEEVDRCATSSGAVVDGWNRALAEILNDFESALQTSLAATGLFSRGHGATAKNATSAQD